MRAFGVTDGMRADVLLRQKAYRDYSVRYNFAKPNSSTDTCIPRPPAPPGIASRIIFSTSFPKCPMQRLLYSHSGPGGFRSRLAPRRRRRKAGWRPPGSSSCHLGADAVGIVLVDLVNLAGCQFPAACCVPGFIRKRSKAQFQIRYFGYLRACSVRSFIYK